MCNLLNKSMYNALLVLVSSSSAGDSKRLQFKEQRNGSIFNSQPLKTDVEFPASNGRKL